MFPPLLSSDPYRKFFRRTGHNILSLVASFSDDHILTQEEIVVMRNHLMGLLIDPRGLRTNYP